LLLAIAYAAKASTPVDDGNSPRLTSARISDCTEAMSYF
jgi:hypothetical protein